MDTTRYYSDGKLDWRKVAIRFGQSGSMFIKMTENPAKPGEFLILGVSIPHQKYPHRFSPPICTSTLGTHSPDPLVEMGLQHAYNWVTKGYSL
jgi:hypothetical protein